MYGIHIEESWVSVVINNLENPIYKEKKNKLYVRINLPKVD